MKIAIDFQSVYGRPTGIGSFAKTLIDTISKQSSEMTLLCYGDPNREDFNTLERMMWESISIPMKALKDKPDLVYSPGFAPAICSPVAQIATVHDLIGMIYPDNQGVVSRFYWSKWLPFTLKRLHYLVTSSESTKRDVVKHLHVSPQSVHVVPLAVGDPFKPIEDQNRIQEILSKYKIQFPYFISVGTLEPRKNLISLLKAYELNRKSKSNSYHLVIVGKAGIAQEELVGYVQERQLEKWVHFLGYVQEKDLAGLYNGALGYITVSLYEGFGLTALEAMSCGKSGVSSNRSSLPEVVGDTAISVDSENIDQIADAMTEFNQNNSLNRTLSNKARERANLFTKEKMAQRMVRIFQETMRS